MCVSTDASGKGASLVAAVVQKQREEQHQQFSENDYQPEP
jgi:hypothetical protein